MKRPHTPSRPAIHACAILTLTLMLASTSAPVRADQPPRVEADVILRGGTLIDGTGAPSRPADLAIRGDRIVAVGTVKAIPGARVVDVAGLVVAPGFIDLHTHSDQGITRPSTRLNANYLVQGVTTIVTGNCGAGALDAARYFAVIDTHGAGTNVIHLIPHGEVRSTVLGNADRAPDPNPFWGIYAAITRQDAKGRPTGGWHPEHRLSLEEALRGHTAGSAYAAFAEDRVGILKPGFRADVTVVDRDLFRVTPKELLATRVVLTIVEGQVAFELPRP